MNSVPQWVLQWVLASVHEWALRLGMQLGSPSAPLSVLPSAPPSASPSAPQNTPSVTAAQPSTGPRHMHGIARRPAGSGTCRSDSGSSSSARSMHCTCQSRTTRSPHPWSRGTCPSRTDGTRQTPLAHAYQRRTLCTRPCCRHHCTCRLDTASIYRSPSQTRTCLARKPEWVRQ